MFKVDEKKLKKGLEELMRHQIIENSGNWSMFCPEFSICIILRNVTAINRIIHNVIETIVIDIGANGLLGNMGHLDRAKIIYGCLRHLASEEGIDTMNYNLTCSRLIERVNETQLKFAEQMEG